MNSLTSLRDLLPLLLVLCPVIGFLVTLAAAHAERDLVRQLAVSNSLCTLLVLGGLIWQLQRDLNDDQTTLRVAQDEDTAKGPATISPDVVRDQLDKRRVERLGQHWFAVDGINLWPVLVLVVLTGLIVWRTDTSIGNSNWFIPNVLLFESASLAALTSCDLRALLLASGLSMLAMTVMIGRWGGPERRDLAGRFLLAQFCGSSFVMLGFAMLVVGVPWMKMEDSHELPNISWNIVSLVDDIQRWTSRNELAFQYENEVFPWMLLVLSLGFAIQFGLFPIHWWQVSILSECPPVIAALCLAGSMSIGSIGWLRFVVPLAPELLAGFDWLILISSLGGAIWGGLRALLPNGPRRRAAYLFVSLSGLSLLGCYCFTGVGFVGAWLMQQQSIFALCAVMLVIGSHHVREKTGLAFERTFQSGLMTRTLLLMLCLPALGLFASSSMIVSQLVRESLLLTTSVFVVGGCICLTMFSLVNRRSPDEGPMMLTTTESKQHRGPFIVVVVLAAVVNLFPNLMVHQCEPEFDRVFRRFERASSVTGMPKAETKALAKTATSAHPSDQ